ncbi:hypothetical protein BC941DRAFT_434319 [Chlamydoabsidia padenii]|nr:hypothetical protein BC941DRAFT_434319 [Chlamydoabsidia padenii]
MKSILLCVGLFVSSTFASVRLTEDNIKLKTSQGNWFVLYYDQPSSTVTSWNQIADELANWKQHGVYFGSVDCDTESSLPHCQTKNSIQKYINGDNVKSYQVPTELTPFIKQQIVSGTHLRGSVVLTKEYLDLIGDGSSPWFVKFYAPWCGHCKKLAPVWDTFADVLASTPINLAEVNCETDRDLCSSQKVAGLPTLKFYNGGASFEYAGDRTLEHLKQYVEKMTGPATQVIDHSSLSSVYANPVSLIHIHPKGDNLDAIKSVATKFMDSIPFYTTDDPLVISALKLDNGKRQTVLIKDAGTIQLVYDNNNEEQDYIKWVQSNKFPLVTRVDSGNAKDILKGDRLVVLLLLPNEMADDSFRSLARSGLDSGATFAELNGKTWASYVKRVYGVTQLPAIVIIDPKNKVYFNQDLSGVDLSIDRPEALFDALRQTDQLIGHTTEPPRSVSVVHKIVNFIGDHAIAFGVGLFGLCLLIATLAYSLTNNWTQKEDKKKED